MPPEQVELPASRAGRTEREATRFDPIRRRHLLAALGVWLAIPGAPAASLQPWFGTSTRPLALQDTEGRAHDLADYRGKVVVVNFWAVWCEPCRDEMPSLRRLKERLAQHPFEVLAVNLGDSPARIAEFVAKVPLNFPVLSDRTGTSKRVWEVSFMPASYVIAPDGRIRLRVLGEIDWERQDTVGLIEKLLPAAGKS